MSKRSLLVAVAMMLAFGPAAPALAQDAPSPNSGGLGKLAESGGVELAAFTLNPLDMEDGVNGLSSGRYVTLEEDARAINNVRGGSSADEEELLGQLEDAGWQQRYFLRFGTQDGDNPDFFATSVYSSVTEYADEDGAATGYEILTSAIEDGGYLPARGGDDVGDESVATRYQWTTEQGAEANELDIVFRTGVFVAEVLITDFLGEQPDIDTANTLAAVQQERLDGAPDAESPGVSRKTLMVKGETVETYSAYYDRLNDAQYGDFGASRASIRSDDEYFADLGVTSTFAVAQGVPLASGDGGYAYFSFQIHSFKDMDSAQATFDTWNETFTTNPPTGIEDAAVAREADDYGDASGTFTYSYDGGGTTYSGYRSHILVGEYLILIAVDSADGVDFGGYEKLANAAVKCAGKSSACKAVAVPAEFDV